jgi:uncharacterized protein (TIRG00374 family)
LKKLKIKNWIYWLKFIVGILLVVIIFRKINQNESVFGVLADANLLYVFFALILLAPHIFIAFLKWRYLLRISFPDISNKDSFGSLLFGITLGMVTPGNIGELGRGLFFQDKSKMVITGLAVIDKLTNFLVMGTLGFFSINVFLFNQLKLSENITALIIIGGAILMLFLWVTTFKNNWVRFLVKKILDRFPENSQIRAFLAAFKQINHKNVFVILVLTFIWFSIIILQYHILISGFTKIELVRSFQGVTAAIFTKMFLPLSFGGLGIREGVTVFYFSLLNISKAAVFNTSLIIFLINFIIPAVIGFYHVLRLNRSKKINVNPLEELEPELDGNIKND